MLGQHELDEMLAERTKLNTNIQKILDEHTDAWGIKISMVEIKQIDFNENMIRAIAQQAEAERGRRAKVIHADGELQASQKLLEAAQMLIATTASLTVAIFANVSRILAKKKIRRLCFRFRLSFYPPLSKRKKLNVRRRVHI